MLPALSLLVALFGPPGSAEVGIDEGEAASEQGTQAEPSEAGLDTATPDDGVASEVEAESAAAEGEAEHGAHESEHAGSERAPDIKVRRGPAVSWTYEPGKLRRRPRLEVEAAAERTVRGEIWYTQAVDGSTDIQLRAPARLRGRVRAHIGRFGAGLDLQDARIVNAPTRSVRSGMHQLFFDFEQPTGPGSIAVRVGRQEIIDASGHMLWHAPWAAGMRSWDAIDMRVELGRGFWLRAFGGSLARPVLGSPVGLADQVRLRRELGWMGQAGYRRDDRFEIDLAVIGRHVDSVAPPERREHYTPQLRLAGTFARGFSYELEGRVQFGSVQGREQLAGAGFGRLRYLSPGDRFEGPVNVGGQIGFDVASGGPCTEAEPAAAGPCGPGKVYDFDSPWRGLHRWFGHADRFAASNVGDLFFGLRVESRPFPEHRFALSLVNHVFTLVDPRGRWLEPGGALVGVDPNNRERGLADEIDLEARWTWGVISVSAGWLVVANLAGGRALSGERWRHMTYGWLEFKY